MGNERIGTLYLREKDSINLFYELFIPTRETRERVVEANERISKGITIREVDNGFIATINDLDLSFLNNMRDATFEEQNGIASYIMTISHNTGINFFDILKGE